MHFLSYDWNKLHFLRNSVGSTRVFFVHVDQGLILGCVMTLLYSTTTLYFE
jgi:hypothetical protein